MFIVQDHWQVHELCESSLKTGAYFTLLAPNDLCTRLPLTWLLNVIEKVASCAQASLIIDTHTHRGKSLQMFEATPHITWHHTRHLHPLPPGLYWYHPDLNVPWLSYTLKESLISK